MIRPLVLASLAGVAMVAGATSAGAQATDAAPQGVGACVWEKLSDPIKADFLAAYPEQADRNSLNRAMARLSRYNAAVQVAGRGCTEVNPPAFWVIRAVATHAVRLGAASMLDRQAGIGRGQLDAVWKNASDIERGCLRVRAGLRFGLKMPPCQDPAYEKALLQPLQLSRPADTAQALRYLRATAESQIAEALIVRRQGGV
jgi:hypothetical protein